MKKVYAIKEQCLGEQEYHLELLKDIYKIKEISKEKFNELYYKFCECSREDLNKHGLNLSGIIGFTSADAIEKETGRECTVMYVIEFPIKPDGSVYTYQMDEDGKFYIEVED